MFNFDIKVSFTYIFQMVWTKDLTQHSTYIRVSNNYTVNFMPTPKTIIHIIIYMPNIFFSKIKKNGMI